MNRYKGGKLVEFKNPGEEDYSLPAKLRPEVTKISKRLSKAVLGGLRRSKTAFACGKMVLPIPTEHDEQAAFVDYLRKCRPVLKFFAVPNGARVRPAVANRLKAEGMSPGVPDLVFPYPVGKFHGLYIEMKRSKDGAISDDQGIWIHFLRCQGYVCEVAAGCKEAMEILDEYFRFWKKP